MKPINVGLIGIGTVGGGTWTVLKRNADEIARRAGRPIRITAVADKNVELAKQVTGGEARVTDDAFSLVNDPEIEVIVEVLGGLSPSKELVTEAIKNKKHIVTANKDLIATHGAELFDLARENNVQIQFEASVCGGIPIINTLKQTLNANKFSKVLGILNGTTNYILSEMLSRGISFEKCLKEAQDLGYAEPDPTNDVSGKDSAYKAAQDEPQDTYADVMLTKDKSCDMLRRTIEDLCHFEEG